MDLYWTDQFWNTTEISLMTTEHILNAINYLQWKYRDESFDYISQEDWKWLEEYDKKILPKYQSLHNELVVRLANKFLLGNDKTDVE